jgi:AraC family transcriptional regulator
METILEYRDFKTGKASDCGRVLDIQESSRNLDWDGIILEKGTSPYFHPQNVQTPYFYFALALDLPFHWQVKHPKENLDLITHPDEIWINPPAISFSHEINEPCAFIILAIEEKRMFESFPIGIKSDSLEFLADYNVIDPSLKSLIDMFYQEVTRNGSTGKDFIDNLLKIFAEYYLKHYSNYEELISKQSSTSFGPKQLELVQEYYKANMSETLHLEKVCEQVSMSLFHFLREFKKYTSITPHQYLINLKIEQAKIELKNSDKTLMEMAYDLGFSDQSHFSRTFKRLAGMSPKEYRRMS